MAVRSASEGILSPSIKGKVVGESVHSREMAESTILSGYSVENFIPPLDIIRILNKAKIRFVLLGIHGLVGWLGEPRQAQSVELVVPARSHQKAITTLSTHFANLVPGKDESLLLDLKTQKPLIIVRRAGPLLLRKALQHTHEVKAGSHTYLIPSLEMAIAMKAPVISMIGADPDKYMDGHDFMFMVKTNPEIDLEKLAELSEQICLGGGRIILEKVRQVRAGEKLQL